MLSLWVEVKETHEDIVQQMQEQVVVQQQSCYQAGYLPVPLAHVPPEGLAQLEVYLFNNTSNTYSLYRHPDLPFGEKDYMRLQESGVEFVYVLVRDHLIYYQTMEKALSDIVGDPKIKHNRKSSILYSTGLELANQLLDKPPEKQDVERTGNIAQATVKMVLDDKHAFQHLFQAFDHDFYTATHMVNVCGMAVTLGINLGFVEEKVLEKIGMGAMLHDIGKIFISQDLLNYPGKISSSDYAQLQQHVLLGYEHLMRVAPELPSEVKEIVLEHHERLDGSGYPNGLKHDQISELGRLAGIVDSFEAMTSVRPYRDHTFTFSEALEELEKSAPDKYDQNLVRIFTTLMDKILQEKSNAQIEKHPDEDSREDYVKLKFDDDLETIMTRYYFRMGIDVSYIERRGAALHLGKREKMIANWITKTSLGILVHHSIDMGQHLVLHTPRFHEIGIEKLIGSVQHCANHSNGWSSVKLGFLAPIRNEILSKIVTLTAAREMSVPAAE